MDQKYAYLSKNIILFAISGFAPKILVFLLVPLYTRTLTTYEYGIGDLIVTTVGLLLPILTLSIGESVLRFCFDKDFTYQELLTNVVFIFMQGFIILCVLLLGVSLVPGFSIKLHYLIALGLIFLSHGLYEIITNFARGIDKIRVMVKMSVISTFSTCILNILFLLFLNFKLDGFLMANYLGTLLSCIYGIFNLKIWKFIDINWLNKSKRKELRCFSTPLIFNKISWWLNNAASRYLIAWTLGAATNGIYTVAYKIPTILTTCSGIFAQAWQISAIKEFGANDSKFFITNLYNLYNAFLVLCCSALILLDIPISKFLYGKDFFIAWQFVPPLLIAFIFGGLTGFIGSLFIAVKDTKIFTTSTVTGGIINVILTYVLSIYYQTAMGAAIATLVSNIVIWAIRLYTIRVYVRLIIPYGKHVLMYGLLFFQLLFCLQGLDLTYVVLQLIIFTLLVFLNWNEVTNVFEKIIKVINERF